MKREPAKIGTYSFCRWHDCRGCESQSRLDTYLSTQTLLHLKMDPASMGGLRQVMRSLDLGMDLSRMNDDDVVNEMTYLFERKLLRRCGELHASTTDTRPAANDRAEFAANELIRVLGGTKTLRSSMGGPFQIIRAAHWRQIRQDPRFQVVPIDEARKLVANIIASPTVAPTEKDAWQRASELLQAPGTLRYDGGLLLLRIVPQRSLKSTSTEPPITPSQLARLVNTHWVAIEVVDEQGIGVEGISYSIITPDNQEYTGVTDASGGARIDNIPAGQCKISFPDLDKSAYRAA
jgi:hypothetical protein